MLLRARTGFRAAVNVQQLFLATRRPTPPNTLPNMTSTMVPYAPPGLLKNLTEKFERYGQSLNLGLLQLLEG